MEQFNHLALPLWIISTKLLIQNRQSEIQNWSIGLLRC